MKQKITITSIIVLILVFIVSIFFYYRQQKKDYYNLLIMTGATPLAIDKDVPPDFSLTVEGLVKKTYQFSGSALNAYAKTRIRTQELSPSGAFTGAYMYMGIPVFNILEGIAPEKPKNTIFNQPLDILVTFISSSGQKKRFSYNELIMAGDQFPVTLAYNREPVLPTTEKVRETYAFNLDTRQLKGFRLICPKETDTGRYLDDVVRIYYSTPNTPDTVLPVRQKGIHCISQSVQCMDFSISKQANSRQAVFTRVARQEKEKWVRIGHGHGYEGITRAEGYNLRSFLKTNFPECGSSDFFLFVACDGYRCLFSGREIFDTNDGKEIMIIDSLGGKSPEEGLMLSPTADYFTDRAMWGFSYAVRLNKI